MKASLYFICPTDGLECVINRAFKGRNYFYSSLGNSVEFDESCLGQIKYMIENEGITRIIFILARDNRILLGTDKRSDHAQIAGMKKFDMQIRANKKLTEVHWKNTNKDRLLLSCHLNAKITALRARLIHPFSSGIELKAKIYDRESKCFFNAYNQLLCEQTPCLN